MVANTEYICIFSKGKTKEHNINQTYNHQVGGRSVSNPLATLNFFLVSEYLLFV